VWYQKKIDASQVLLSLRQSPPMTFLLSTFALTLLLQKL
jgi:hypothetical protein